jgi:hypothetical protein
MSLTERLGEDLDRLGREDVRLDDLEQGDLGKDAERGLVVWVLECEVVPGAMMAKTCSRTPPSSSTMLRNFSRYSGVFGSASRPLGVSWISPT